MVSYEELISIQYNTFALDNRLSRICHRFSGHCSIVITRMSVLDDTEHTYLELSINGKTILMPEDLLRRLDKEQEVWHWTPWQRTRVEYVDNVARELVTRDSIESFPDGIFDGE